MSISVGIDLGTTYSAVAYINPKTKLPQIIPNREGSNLTPSVIQFLDDEVIFGSEAEEAYNAGVDNCVATFKREMGEETPYCYVDGKPYTSEDFSSMLLKHLKEDAEAVSGETIKDAVITVPAYFFSKQREATLRAAEKAGLKVKKLIDEPNAAAMAYGLNHWRENANILVYDLGGGTFDVTLVHMGKDGELKTITTQGDHKLGGRDWDARVCDILIEKFEYKTGLSIKNDHELFLIVNGMSEDVKKQLSAQNMMSINVTTSFPGYGSATVTVTRQEFEDRSADLLDRTGALCMRVLEETELTVKGVTDVLLVGGSTRMPQVSAYLQKMFNKRPLTHINPDEAVALGAALQTMKNDSKVEYADLSVQIINGKKTTDRTQTGLSKFSLVKSEHKLNDSSTLSILETTAHAMGVVAINDDGNRYYNEIVIPANHPRPVRAAKRFRFYTSPNSDNELAIYVLQGDSEYPLDCQITNKYVVTGIKHVSRGEKIGTVIRIQYSYDINGIIHVQARQDDSTVDLPIHEQAPDNISRFGKPVTDDDRNRGFSTGLQIGYGRSQNVVHKYKAITFSNVEWKKYDRILIHPSGAQFHEPKTHIVANEKKIEFHGYNISEMNEGVRYTVNPSDDFEIECDIDTSTIKPHPGGYLEISLGLISAQLTENGGSILLGGETVATVDPRFHLKMSLTEGGKYEVDINGKNIGSKYKKTEDYIDVRFGFVHASHYCELLSHAYISDISMLQAVAQAGDDSPDTDTWDD